MLPMLMALCAICTFTQLSFVLGPQSTARSVQTSRLAEQQIEKRAGEMNPLPAPDLSIQNKLSTLGMTVDQDKRANVYGQKVMATRSKYNTVLKAEWYIPLACITAFVSIAFFAQQAADPR